MAKSQSVPEVEEIGEQVSSISLDVEYALRQAGKKDWKRVTHALLRITESLLLLAKKCDKAKVVRDPKGKQEDQPIHNP